MENDESMEDMLAEIEENSMYENILDLTNSSQERLNEKRYGEAFQHARDALDTINELIERDPNMSEELKIYRRTAEENLARSRVLWENPKSGETILEMEGYAQNGYYEYAEDLLKQIKSKQPKIE